MRGARTSWPRCPSSASAWPRRWPGWSYGWPPMRPLTSLVRWYLSTAGWGWAIEGPLMSLGPPADGAAADGLPRPEAVLPHRPPFLFVDKVTALDPGRSASGVWQLTGDEAFFQGHFPGRPTLPGVLMVEAMAQLGGIALLSEPRFSGYLPLFGGIDKARFRRQVGPGDLLEMTVELDQ